MALPSQPESGGSAPPSSPAQRWSVLEVLRWTTTRFAQRNLSTPRLDAEVLIAHALGLSRVQLYVQFERPLEAAELAAIRELVRRRQAGESVAYLTGRKEFFGLELEVDARVLVPRPDTETLVDEALARLAAAAEVGGEAAPGPRIADVGTGSGAVAIAIAKMLDKSAARMSMSAAKLATSSDQVAAAADAPAAASAPAKRPAPQVFASDLSPGALELAGRNAERHGAAITFLQGDLDEPLRSQAPFDLIAANLPYIPSAEIAGLSAEVRGEPHLALDGGTDGLELVRRLVAAAPALLRAGGAIVLEIGAGQAEATAAQLAAAGFIEVRRRRDLGGIERVVSGVKP